MFRRVDGVEGPRTLSEGTMLDDKYRIERLLATGGMGAVYLGTHTRLRKRVAIKILNPQLSSTPMIERFHREAITASQIGHEGIAQVTDIGTSREGEPFLVMEYLEGESLANRLHRLGALAIQDACELGCTILSPLGAAHRAGIVHRDLKPDNVFLVRQSRGETVKLLDFGISRTVGCTSEFRLTNTGLVLGTPYYMSPEQARGESQITPAADLYAFGVILYETLVGDVPIRAENYNQLMYRVTIGEFARPREQRPEIPEDLEQIILHAMAQSAEDRPASTALIEQALLSFCRPVFREHANGRISAPGLSFQPASSRGDLDDHARFAGSTVSDTYRYERFRAPSDTDRSPAVEAVPDPDERAEPAWSGSPTALPTFALPDDPAPSVPPAPRRSLARRILSGLAIIVGSAAAAGSLVIMLAGRDRPPAATTPDRPRAAPIMTLIAQPPPDHGTRAQVPSDHPARQESTTITLRLAVTPSGATITLDGARVSGPEFVVHKDAVLHRLRITAAGYAGYDEALSFDENQRLVVQLKHTAGPTRGKDSRRDAHKNGIESKSPYE
jgi:serine/threonine-protein kinase